MDIEDFDVVVLGAGPAGEVAAGRVASHGMSVAIVERELAGGECSYWACIPSKALLRPTAVLQAARRIPGAAEAVTGSLDVGAVLAQRTKMISGFDDSSQVSWIQSQGIEFVRGHGRITSPGVVDVEGTGPARRLRASRAVVVATGSRAAVPPIAGLENVNFWTSRQATTADEVPQSLVIVGGGVVATEMAAAWTALGSAVTMVVRGDRLLGNEEPFASELIASSLQDSGVVIHFDAEVSEVSTEPAGVRLQVADTDIEATHLLVATGRHPNTDDIGLNAIGLEPGRHIGVDDQLRAEAVSGGWLYAVGDAADRSLLTHMGKYQATLAADAIAGRDVAVWAEHHAVPSVVFTDPQVASVGIRLHPAQLAGLDAVEVKVPISSVAAASIDGVEVGCAQLVIDRQRDVIIGATFVAPDAGDLIHGATIAIVGELPLAKLRHAVPAFPTMNELWLRLIEAHGL